VFLDVLTVIAKPVAIHFTGTPSMNWTCSLPSSRSIRPATLCRWRSIVVGLMTSAICKTPDNNSTLNP
jgi:hypothetical protein